MRLHLGLFRASLMPTFKMPDESLRTTQNDRELVKKTPSRNSPGGGKGLEDRKTTAGSDMGGKGLPLGWAGDRPALARPRLFGPDHDAAADLVEVFL